jgi:Ankyrin repeats (3 copies)
MPHFFSTVQFFGCSALFMCAACNTVLCCQNTALHYACLGGHVEAVHLLLDKKADVTLKNTYNHSPLDLAIDNMHHDVVIALLRNKRLFPYGLSINLGCVLCKLRNHVYQFFQ